MRIYQQLIRILLIFGVLITSAATVGATGTDTSVLRDAVTLDGILSHLEALQRIADANGGNRAAGTPGYMASAGYVRDTLEAAGYKVEVQEFPFVYYAVDVQQGRTLGPTPRNLAPRVMAYSPSTAKDGIEGAIAVVPTTDDPAVGCEASDFAGQDYTDKIALILRGRCTFAQKARHARDAGAVAALIYNNDPDPNAPVVGSLGGVNHATIPVAGISRATGEALIADTANGDQAVRVFLNLQSTTETRTTSNVIAESRWGPSDRVVMIGGHLDSVADGAGINDNGSGVATILEIAVQMAEQQITTKNKIRFAFWGAEELGLLGSQHYVRQLQADEREQILLYLNFDMVGSPNYARFLYADARTQLSVPQRTQTIEQVFGDYFAAQRLASKVISIGDRSDHGPFMAAGIPIGGLFTGAEGIKSEAEVEHFGGTADAAYDRCYHRACDNLSNLNHQALSEMSDAAAHVLLMFALPESVANIPSRNAGNDVGATICAVQKRLIYMPLPC